MPCWIEGFPCRVKHLYVAGVQDLQKPAEDQFESFSGRAWDIGEVAQATLEVIENRQEVKHQSFIGVQYRLESFVLLAFSQAIDVIAGTSKGLSC